MTLLLPLSPEQESFVFLEGLFGPGIFHSLRSSVELPEDFMDFFSLLVLNTRQGFYGDPVYGGNLNRIGWGVIGFDGPPSLRSTTDGSYTTTQYMISDATWPYEQHPQVLRYRRRK